MAFSSDQPLLANQLPISIEFPNEVVALSKHIDLTYKRIANAVNTKEGALYVPQETATFQQYYKSATDPLTFRPVYRKVIIFGALPNTATKSVAHGIPFGATFTLTRLFAAATDPVNFIYLPIPYASPTAASNIEIYADATNINIITGSNRTAFTICNVVIEYMKVV